MNMYNAIVAGAGLWGCTLARRLAESGKRVLLLERRPVVGGNVRCEIDKETGIEIHTYGSHIFHTNNEHVWEFVNRFARFNGYRHKVVSRHKGRLYHLPLGRTLYDEFFGEGKYTLPLTDDQNSEIFDSFFANYTAKQWGKPASEIDPLVFKRIPVRDNYDTSYFNDKYQGIPVEGYNSLVENMVNHPCIHVRVDMPFTLDWTPQSVITVKCPVYYSGPLDALFGFKHGALPWRTLRFEFEKLNIGDYQGTAVVNYPDLDVPYTRIHEFKHYHPEWMQTENTIIMREYSSPWEKGDEPYYPIANAASEELQMKYLSEVVGYNQRQEKFNLITGGRLGGYRYYDMDKSIEAALKVKIN